MKTQKILIILALTVGALWTTQAQTNTFYFMDEVPMRNSMNPAFLPNTEIYFDFIFLPNLYLGVGNNSFTMKDFLINQNGQTVTALHPSLNVDDFYKRIKKTTAMDMEFQLNLLSFGFRFKEKNYITFDMDMRMDGGAYLPRDIFKLGLYGTPDEYGINRFDFRKVGLDATLYSEIGVGYMRRLNDQWTVGGKVKFLMGYAGATSRVKKMQLNASQDSWDVNADAAVYGSIPMNYEPADDGGMGTFSPYDNPKDYLKLLYKPAGYGAAIELGVTYEPIKHLVVSAAITDLGFIYWNKNLIRGTMKGDYSFTGIDYEPGDTINLSEIGEEIGAAFNFQTDNATPFAHMMRANANIAIEYGILDNKISFGLLSRTRFNAQRVSEEVTLAANFRPLDWLKAYLTYSFVNSRWNNLGLGLSVRAGVFNMFIAADYIPLNWAKVTTEGNPKPMAIPYNTQRVNLQVGMSWNIGRDSGDKDRDGVKNSKDQCPKTDIKSLRKLCPEVNRKEFVDLDGCTLDEDKDSVPDCYDQCPGTPPNTPVDSVGCPFDDDNDGVYNHLDSCPNTPLGVIVDSKGCPLDDDNDGVPNYLDQCPNTPELVMVDSVGCPLDNDGDGVPDYLDKCPNTPALVVVDSDGCPLDSDGDGVPDYLDECPKTPKEAYGKVDEKGCPKDSDGDSVPDYLDKCPYTVGLPSNYGCPELKTEVRSLFEKAMRGIQFETGKDIIKKTSYSILNSIVEVMVENPTYELTINGYTDDVGNDASNQVLSEKRAASVKKYLTDKGVAVTRMTSNGFGENDPVADNKTSKGRALNRRVEFLVSFEEVSYEKVINPELEGIINTTPEDTTVE